jgi:hypothetical protein
MQLQADLIVGPGRSFDFGPTPLRRFTYRTDGFVSVNSPAAGELLTRPLCFAGKSLQINASTSSSGFIKVELCNEAGQPLPGFEAAQCVPLAGDEIAWTVKRKGNPDHSVHAGQPVRLRYILKEADLFAMQFHA